MARALQQGIGSMTVLIVFVALWLASTVVLVILYTRQEELRTANARLEEDNLRLISPAERRSVPLFQNASANGPTVVGLLEGARSETAALASGEPANDTATVRGKLDDFLRRIRNDRIVPDPEDYENLSYHEALTMLYEAFGAERSGRVDAEQRVAQLQAGLDKAVETNAQQKANFETRAREFTEQLADVEAGRGRYRRERDEQVAVLEREFDERRQQSDADLTQERQRSTALEEQLGQFQHRFIQLQQKFAPQLAGPQELSTARQPDGEIITAIPGDDVV